VHGGHYRFEDWLLEILPEGRAQAAAAAAALREVYARTAQALVGVDVDVAFDLCCRRMSSRSMRARRRSPNGARASSMAWDPG
jgi:hypothetical protein